MDQDQAKVETGQVRPTLHQEAQDLALEVSTLMLTAILLLAAVQSPLTEVAATDNGAMESTLLDQLTHVLSESCLVFSMTQLSNRLVSTLRSTTTFQSKHLVTMFQNQSQPSLTHLLMTISSATSSLHTTKSQLQFRSTLFQSLWAVVT